MSLPAPRALRPALLLLLGIFAHFAVPVRAAASQTVTGPEVTGRVVDAATSQPLPGVRVRIFGPVSVTAVTDTAGFFDLGPAGVPEGRYKVEAERVGYAPGRLAITKDASPLNLTIRLSASAIPGPEVEVNATRSEERKSAAAFTELSGPEIRERYWAQDVPVLLTQTPGVYAYSDAGSGLGYSYISIRGFPQRRVAVTLNGIPENDPESHEVYWVDHPDLLASAATVQVQRGVGSALYGSSAVGGSVNLETPTVPADRRFEVDAGFGSYNTRRFSAQYESGLIENRYAVSGRYSSILTDGYRDQSWAKLWSFYLSATRLDSRLTSRLNVYGGPENLHLAFLGVTGDYLSGQVSGDAERDRKFNPLSWKDETDNFYEPHYELIQTLRLSNAAALTSSLFFFSGAGYYNDMPGTTSFASLHLPEFEVDSDSLYPAGYYATGEDGRPVRQSDGRYRVIASDITDRLWVEDRHYGWIPRVRVEHERGEFTAGGEWRQHDGHHYGLLTWAQALPGGTDPNHVYYDYTGDVRSLSAFAQESYLATEDVRVTGSLQWRGTRYGIHKDPFNGYDFDLSYSFLNPRLGVNWNLDPKWNAFANFAHTQTEPVLSDIYRPDDPSSVPLFRIVDPANGVYQDPLVHPEALNDYEAGAGYRAARGYFKATGFWMDFRDELVSNGQIDRLGNPIVGNAARSRHRGVELEGGARFGPADLTGNLTWSSNRFVDYREYITDSTYNDYSGNSIANFPAVLANFSLGLRRGDSRVALGISGAGTQYLDNSEDNRKDPALNQEPGYQRTLIPGRVTLNADATVALGDAAGLRRLWLDVHFVNLLNRMYVASGYVDDFGPEFIPAAGRNLFAGLRAEF